MEITLYSLARFINIALALILIGYSFFVILSLGGFNPLSIMMAGYYMYFKFLSLNVTLYYSIFALLMILSHCNFECIKRNFYLLVTLKGRGVFNIL